VRLAGLEREPQRHAFAEQVLLANHLTQAFRAQAFGQGLVAMGCGVHWSLLWLIAFAWVPALSRPCTPAPPNTLVPVPEGHGVDWVTDADDQLKTLDITGRWQLSVAAVGRPPNPFASMTLPLSLSLNYHAPVR
jgi:hypothetical protein